MTEATGKRSRARVTAKSVWRAALETSLVAALALQLASCSGGKQTIESDIAGLRSNLEKKKWGEVWLALSNEQQQSIDEAQFVRALDEDPGIAAGLMALLDEAATSADVTYRAVVTLSDGSTVVFVLEAGNWLVETPITDFYPRATPAQALASFVAAYQAGRWDVLAGLMPPKYSGEDDASVLEKAWGTPEGREEMDRLVKIVQAHVGDPVAVQGNSAILVYPEGQITFQREGGSWVILDFD